MSSSATESSHPESIADDTNFHVLVMACVEAETRLTATARTPHMYDTFKEASTARKDLVAHIDAKLAQAGDDWRDRACALEARLGEVMERRDEFRDRAIAAESRLAEIQRCVEGLTPLGLLQSDRGTCEIRHVDDGEYLDRESVLDLFEVQEFESGPKLKVSGAQTTATVTTYKLTCDENGAPIREVQPAPAEGSFTREEARAAVIAVMDSEGEPG